MKRFLILTFSVALLTACGTAAGSKEIKTADNGKTINTSSEKTTVPDSIGGTNVAIDWPNMWLSGSRFRNRIG